MDIKSGIAAKYKKGNQLLFSRDSECLQSLIRLIGEQKHRALVAWALDCAREPLSLLEEKVPRERRPQIALERCEAWARGSIKMPEAKRAILNAHTAAKELDDRVCAAYAHAIGHAGAAVHVETHALGLVLYELTGIVYDTGLDKCGPAVEGKIQYYMDRLTYWQRHIDSLDTAWADFLMDDTRPNKERLLSEKRRSRP